MEYLRRSLIARRQSSNTLSSDCSRLSVTSTWLRSMTRRRVGRSTNNSWPRLSRCSSKCSQSSAPPIKRARCAGSRTGPGTQRVISLSNRNTPYARTSTICCLLLVRGDAWRASGAHRKHVSGQQDGRGDRRLGRHVVAETVTGAISLFLELWTLLPYPPQLDSMKGLERTSRMIAEANKRRARPAPPNPANASKSTV